MTRFADPGWLLGVTDEGLAALGPDAEIEIALEDDVDSRISAVRELAAGTDAPALAAALAWDVAEADELLEALEGPGLLVAGPPADRGDCVSVGQALAAATDGRPGRMPRFVSTAEELLVLPEEATPRQARRALRAFIAGMAPHLRVRLWAMSARTGVETAVGDAPDAERLQAGIESAADLGPDAIGVIRLGDCHTEDVTVDGLARLGGERAHRLGPVQTLHAREGGREETGGLHLVTARAAVPNLRSPGTSAMVATGIARDAGLAELIARAEAVERYAAGDLGRRPLVRAAASELHGAVSLDAFHLSNARQLEAEGGYDAFGPDEMHLWTPAVTAGGATRWVPGRAVHYPFDDPERSEMLPGATSSGMAAHTEFAEARERAFAELVERDAFIWTWTQSVSRELVEPGSLPPEARSLVEALSGHGFEVALVNLTLETAPVMLAVVYDEHRLSLGAACHPSASAAARKALEEVSRAAFMGAPTGEPPAPEEVSTTHDHLLLHQGAGRRPDHGFLFSSTERIHLREIEDLDRPLFRELSEFGEPLVVDLTSPSTRPFHVVRALVGGMVPITFGWDRESLGTPRLAEPRSTRDGRLLGERLTLDRAGPVLPHPFP